MTVSHTRSGEMYESKSEWNEADGFKKQRGTNSESRQRTIYTTDRGSLCKIKGVSNHKTSKCPSARRVGSKSNVQGRRVKS